MVKGYLVQKLIVRTHTRPAALPGLLQWSVKAKFHYASWFGAGSKLVRSQISAQTCFEQAPNQFFSSVFDPISIKLGNMLHVWP